MSDVSLMILLLSVLAFGVLFYGGSGQGISQGIVIHSEFLSMALGRRPYIPDPYLALL